MGSGESDIYYNQHTLNQSTTQTHVTGGYDFEWYPSNKIYMYQLTCPACNLLNWCEIEKTVKCLCGAVLKAVSTAADYVITVRR